MGGHTRPCADGTRIFDENGQNGHFTPWRPLGAPPTGRARTNARFGRLLTYPMDARVAAGPGARAMAAAEPFLPWDVFEGSKTAKSGRACTGAGGSRRPGRDGAICGPNTGFACGTCVASGRVKPAMAWDRAHDRVLEGIRDDRSVMRL